MKLTVHQPPEESDIRAKIRAGWGLGRLFRHYQAKHPIHGDTLLLNQVLRVSRTLNRRFPERTIRRIINGLKEKLDSTTKRWLVKSGGYS